MIFIFQIFALFFALTMVYFALLNLKRREISTQEMVIWTVIWLILIITVFFPDIFREFSSTYLSTRLFDLLVIGGISLSLVMVTRAYLITRRMEKRIEDFIRKDAKENASKHGK